MVVDACSFALSRLPEADLLLLLTSGAIGSTQDRPDRPWRELRPGTVISTAPLRRRDHPDRPVLTLSSGAGPGHAEPTSMTTMSVATMVGAALLAQPDASTAQPSSPPRPPTTAFEIIGHPAAVAEMLADRVNSAERVAMLVIADGSACHGDDAPGPRDDRSGPFDAALAEALTAGDPVALSSATADGELNRALLASTDPLTVLALLTAQRPPTSAKLLYSGAPVGVGYFVASWLWGAA